MGSKMSSTKHTAVQPRPAWDVARLFPNQGHWTEGDYLVLNRNTNHFVELVEGEVEVLEMPTRSHQRTVLYLRDRLRDFTEPRTLGEVVIAPYPVRLGRNRFREPDVVFMLDEHADRLGEDFAEGADLVMEVVSEDRTRDLVEKRREYARARIPEYWIVDRRDRRITVLRLGRGRYLVHGEYATGERATSALLKGFSVDVASVWAAALRSSVE
jgi:Uma2 family endonuclease